MPEFDLKKEGEYRVWIHAVSLGETKAVKALVELIQKELPLSTIVFSTTTETGQKEAKTNLKAIKKTFFLPLDFSFLMKKIVQLIQPDLFILVETDFWFNLLQELKRNHAKIAVVNGKISTTSYKRFTKFKKFSKALFNSVDQFCLQSDTDKLRFLDLGVSNEKIVVTGNMKFDIESVIKNREDLKFPRMRKLVTIASTHENEEAMILKELEKLDHDKELTFLIAPRHPERFNKISELLKKQNISFKTISEEGNGLEKVVLVNQMGIMDECYAHSKAVIMGGSFVDYVGGHNIYEAARHGIPVLYGPHMHKQESIVNSLKKHQIGKQIPLNKLSETLENLLKAPPSQHSIEVLKSEVEGATKRSWNLLKQML
jgi:3-deoxy-D-manno-octulosonic-acid transferase